MVREETMPAESEVGMRRFAVEISEGTVLQVQVMQAKDAAVPDIFPVPSMKLCRDVVSNQDLLTGCVKLANHLLKA